MSSLNYGDRSTSPSYITRRDENMASSASSTLLVPPSSELALTEEYPPAEFRGLNALKQSVAAKYQRLNNGDQDQYLSFYNVTPEDFGRIEAHRVDLGRGAAFTYFGDIMTLIIKLPTEVHEGAHASLGYRIQSQVLSMQVGWDEFFPINAAKFSGGNNSAKEGDSAWKNKSLRPNKGDWPNMVIEAGLSESLSRLRTDARWWIENSGGQVSIVLLIWIRPATKTVKIEKWVPDMQPMRRHSPRFPQPSASTTQVADILIDQSSAPSVIRGAPLRLEFDRIFGRPPQNFLEQDVVFTQNDLDNWARILWIGT